MSLTWIIEAFQVVQTLGFRVYVYRVKHQTPQLGHLLAIKVSEEVFEDAILVMSLR